MKFYGGVLSGTINNWLKFGGDVGLLRWVNEQNNTLMAVSLQHHGGNDPEPLG